MNHSGHLIYWDDSVAEVKHVAVTVNKATEEALLERKLLVKTMEEARHKCELINKQLDTFKAVPDSHAIGGDPSDEDIDLVL